MATTFEEAVLAVVNVGEVFQKYEKAKAFKGELEKIIGPRKAEAETLKSATVMMAIMGVTGLGALTSYGRLVQSEAPTGSGHCGKPLKQRRNSEFRVFGLVLFGRNSEWHWRRK